MGHEAPARCRESLHIIRNIIGTQKQNVDHGMTRRLWWVLQRVVRKFKQMNHE